MLIRRYYPLHQSNVLYSLEALFDAGNIRKSVFLQQLIQKNADQWISVDDILKLPQFSELFGEYGWTKSQYEQNKHIFIKMVQTESQILEISDDKQYIRRIEPFRAIGQQNQMQSEQMKQRGNELFQQKKYRECIVEYLEALRLNESDYKIAMNLSCAYLAIEEYENALKYANKSISIQPLYSKPYARAAMVLFAMNKTQKAIATIGHAIRHQPDNQQYIAFRDQWKMKS